MKLTNGGYVRSLKLICVATALLLGAACGSDDDDASSSATSSAPGTTAAAATTEASDTTAPDTTAAPATSGAPTGMSDEEWQTIVDAANEEGEVTVYNVQQQSLVDAMAGEFAKDYPDIKLNYVRMALADMEARIEAELASGLVADVIEHSTPSYLERIMGAGHVVEPVGPAFSDPDYPFEDSRLDDAFATSGSVYVWAWNTDLVPNGIQSWDDFLALDPGLLGLTDPSISSALTDYYKAVEEPEGAGPGYLDKLAAANLEPQIYPGGNPAGAALAAGEIGAVLPIGLSQAVQQEATGAPVEHAFYEHYWSPNSWQMILKEAPHPNAAQVWANWLVSERGQQVIADHSGVPFLSSIESVVPEGVARRGLKDVTPEESAAFQVRWDELFG